MNTSFHCFLSAVSSRIWCSTMEVSTGDFRQKKTCCDHLNSISDQQNGPAQNAEALHTDGSWNARSVHHLTSSGQSSDVALLDSLQLFYDFYLRTPAAFESTEASNPLPPSPLYSNRMISPWSSPRLSSKARYFEALSLCLFVIGEFLQDGHQTFKSVSAVVTLIRTTVREQKWNVSSQCQ